MTGSSPPIHSVEALVRHQLAQSLGGRRGLLEAAVPTLLFTAIYLGLKGTLGGHDSLRLALGVSFAAAVAALALRLVQRSTTQFVMNALFGIGLGWLFVYLAGRAGGTADDQALAFFLPGLIWTSVYSLGVSLSCLTGWPLVGFLLGSVTGDPTAWRQDRQVVRLCTRLTWVLVLPGIIGVALQGPVWLAGYSGTLSADRAVAILAALRYGLGWPLRFAALGLTTWLLARNHTPLDPATHPLLVDSVDEQPG